MSWLKLKSIEYILSAARNTKLHIIFCNLPVALPIFGNPCIPVFWNKSEHTSLTENFVPFEFECILVAIICAKLVAENSDWTDDPNVSFYLERLKLIY